VTVQQQFFNYIMTRTIIFQWDEDVPFVLHQHTSGYLLCSILWGERQLFVFSLLMELLTITI